MGYICSPSPSLLFRQNMPTEVIIKHVIFGRYYVLHLCLQSLTRQSGLTCKRKVAKSSIPGSSYDSPCHDSPCHTSPCHASPCHASPCQDPPCHDSPCHDSPCHASPCHDSPCHDSARESSADQERFEWLKCNHKIVRLANQSPGTGRVGRQAGRQTGTGR